MASADSQVIEWVAHRGCPTVWPENSLEGFRAALEAGAGFLECDVQLSKDGVPVLFHDMKLKRLTGRPGTVASTTAADLMGLELRPPELSSSTPRARLAPLSNLIVLLEDFPAVTLFVELKTESIKHFGLNAYLDAVLPVLRSIHTSFMVISFSSSVLAALRTQSPYSIGWVIPRWNEDNHAKAQSLQPDWLFCNVARLPQDNESLWPGDWCWALYTLDDHASASRFRQRGFRYLETNRILDMINDRR